MDRGKIFRFLGEGGGGSDFVGKALPKHPQGGFSTFKVTVYMIDFPIADHHSAFFMDDLFVDSIWSIWLPFAQLWALFGSLGVPLGSI